MSSRRVDLLEAVLRHMPDGLIIVDEEDRVAWVNPAAETMRHVKASDIIGQDVRECHSAKSRERVDRALQYLHTAGRAPFSRVTVDHVLGRHFENIYFPLRDEDGNYIGSALISRDTTDRSRLEEKATARTKELEVRVGELKASAHVLFAEAMASLVNALEAKDPYTKEHSMRVRDTVATMAEHSLGISSESADIELAARLHDIGKVAVRDQVLGKPGPLTEEEYQSIKAHSVVGERIIEPIIRLKPVAKLIRHHHERFDGGGYPDGLRGHEIPLGARMLAIADAYDAMRSARPYRSGLAPETAAAEIQKQSGRQFDPELVGLFLELFASGTLG
ncbi:MAG: HD domain-containing protein [Firmicutes bacterium]|nr:HD domain-containing protein [Bacillota bacterium]